MAIITDKKLIKSLMGKKSRANGKKFEVLVRKDLTEKGWNVCRWDNNVEFDKPMTMTDEMYEDILTKPIINNRVSRLEAGLLWEVMFGKCVPAKAKFNPFTKRVMNMSSGFPDFLAYRKMWRISMPKGFDMDKANPEDIKKEMLDCLSGFDVIFVEVKTNGKLDKLERQKAKWYLDNNYCSKFLIAKKVKVKNKIEVEYIDYT